MVGDRRVRTAATLGAAALAISLGTACEPTDPPATTTTFASTTSTTTPTTIPAGTWRPLWSDEFAGSSLDTSRWAAYHSNYGSSNLQLECNTPANVSVADGVLRIASRRQTVSCPGASAPMAYTSGFLGSRDVGRYYPRDARFEIRARVPHAQGLWPAFWLRHRNGAGTAEVDILEYFHSQVPGRATQTLHLDGVANVAKRTTGFEAPTTTPGWHTFAVEIVTEATGVRFTFSIDGATTFSYLDTRREWASKAPADATWDIAVNQAVGGRWVGAPDGTLGYLDQLGRCSIGGTPPTDCTTTGIRRVDWTTPGAATFEVDWVRVSTRTS